MYGCCQFIWNSEMVNLSKTPKKSLESIIVAVAAFILLSSIVIVVGSRDFRVGTDTLTYVEVFKLIAAGYETQYEIGFVSLVKLLSILTLNPFFYFSIITLIITLTYIVFYLIIVDWSWGDRRNSDLILILSLLLVSSWFVTSVINVLRHGMALPWVYLSLILFVRQKYFYSGVAFLLSVGFHFSSLALLPFYLLFFLKRKWILCIVFFAAILYPLGVNEKLIQLVSLFFNIPVHEFIASYGSDSGFRVGFQIDLFIYSIFWLILFLSLDGLIKVQYVDKWRSIVSIYGVLLLPYFVLGFGGFSNRFGYIAWFFLPACLAAFIVWSKFSVQAKIFVGYIWFSFGLFYFFSYFY